MSEKEPERIALLGWGSLLWDLKGTFHRSHSEWQLGGPRLPLEFSRISKTREGALTLVIDQSNGVDCEVAFANILDADLQRAITDLAEREGCSERHIGSWSRWSSSSSPNVEAVKAVSLWATTSLFDGVIWTDLPPSDNFANLSREEFLASALSHLDHLLKEGKTKAAEYFYKAPAFINTPLRDRSADFVNTFRGNIDKLLLSVDLYNYTTSLRHKAPSISAIWLFGSRANRNATMESDWDLLLFGDERVLLEIEQCAELRRTNVDLLVVQPDGKFREAYFTPREGRMNPKSGSLSDWEWNEISDTEAEYVSKKPRPNTKHVDVRRQRAIKI